METVLAGIAAGLVSGYFGVLLALKQFKEQRAFDRQLEWYERTSRALGAASRLLRGLSTRSRYEPLDPNELDKVMGDLEQCINESTLYAEQTSYDLLQRMGVEYETIKQSAASGGRVPDEDLTAAVLRSTITELSKPVRAKLGLKNIVLKDAN